MKQTEVIQVSLTLKIIINRELSRVEYYKTGCNMFYITIKEFERLHNIINTEF
jgi:hypothetical protein